MSQTKIKNKTNLHAPVLLQEVLDTLAPKKGEKYLDLTAGYGGHASEVLSITQGAATLVDRDENAIEVLRSKFADYRQVNFLHSDFLTASQTLVKENQQYDLILADLGVSSPHLDNADRGFSILQDGPLDMRMDPSQDLSAEVVVNTYSATELERILRTYGEEPKARRMAQLIVESRPLKTTSELAGIAKKVWPGHSRSHPATRLFQAVRIEVNDELGQLSRVLPLMLELLAENGRIVIITFHSLEDRIVKQFFKDKAGDRYDAELIDLTKRPLQATPNELVINPRSRSAKIRAAQAKIKTKRRAGLNANTGKN
jgi:16S rRNA (cytosine1402-N4)-methyltransferase